MRKTRIIGAMGVQTAGYLDAIEHLPDGAMLVVHQCAWEEYERLLEDLQDRPHLRVSYDRGTLEIPGVPGHRIGVDEILP